MAEGAIESIIYYFNFFFMIAERRSFIFAEEELYIFYQCLPDFHWRKYREALIIASESAPYLLIPYYILPTGH